MPWRQSAISKAFPPALHSRVRQSIYLALSFAISKHLSGRRAVRRGDLLFCATLVFPLCFFACSRINFCPQKSKLTNFCNSLITTDITCYLLVKSPKIYSITLLLYINFANFLSFPFSKLPNPNYIVSSINAYGVNI